MDYLRKPMVGRHCDSAPTRAMYMMPFTFHPKSKCAEYDSRNSSTACSKQSPCQTSPQCTARTSQVYFVFLHARCNGFSWFEELNMDFRATPRLSKSCSRLRNPTGRFGVQEFLVLIERRNVHGLFVRVSTRVTILHMMIHDFSKV